MAKKNMVGPFSIGTLLILLGALIGIIAIFLTWFDFSVDIFITTLSKTYTGMEFATEDLKTDDFQRLCPLIAWIVAILIAVLNVLPMVGVKIDSNTIMFAVTEKRSKEEIDRVVELSKEI